jgi:hypothetical protein
MRSVHPGVGATPGAWDGFTSLPRQARDGEPVEPLAGDHAQGVTALQKARRDFCEVISIDRRGKEVMRVKYEENRVDEMVLALMHLTTFKESSGYRTWKNHDWEVMDRLHQKGFIGNPKSKVRSVDLTKEGQLRSEELFKKQFS